MKNYYIVDDGKTKLLKFNKLDEFNDKLELAISLKSYNNGFKYEIDKDVRLTKFDRISQSLKIDKEQIILPKQEHTDNIKILDEKDIINNKWNTIKDTDGLITNVRKAFLATTFADCTPLFFYDPVKNVIANIHSGWLGTTKKIGAKAVDMLINKMECNPKNILCLIGPHIRKDHFLVNDDVKEIFETTFKNLCKSYDIIENTELYNERGKQYRIDTTLINKIMLKEKGILEENIYDCDLCTVCNKDIFHSYRVEGKKYEVNTGIIYLK